MKTRVFQRKKTMEEPVSIGVAEDTTSSATPTEQKQKRKYTRRAKVTSQIDPKTQQQLHQLVTMLATAAFLLVPFQYRPLDAELQAIFLPLERIYLRHAPSTEINPDITDCILALLGVVVYASRVYSTHTTFRNAARKPEPQFPSNTATNSARTTQQSGPSTVDTLRSNGFTSAEDRLAALHRATFRDDSGNDRENVAGPTVSS